MATNFVQPGNIIAYTPTAAVSSGQVVRVGSLMGVALHDIPAGVPGQVQVTGVFSVPKVAADVLAAGDPVAWIASANAFGAEPSTPAAGDVTGSCFVAWQDADAGTVEMLVKFTGVPGVVH